MQQNTENRLDLKNKIIAFYNNNKLKIYISILILILILIFSIFLTHLNNKKNILISEKYIQASIYLKIDKKNNAKTLYEEIILSKNSFYSILALNNIIEKNLIEDKDKILDYFKILEKNISKKENKDLILFKKALFLINTLDSQKGNDLLKDLINKNSSLKNIAEELIQK